MATSKNLGRQVDLGRRQQQNGGLRSATMPVKKRKLVQVSEDTNASPDSDFSDQPEPVEAGGSGESTKNEADAVVKPAGDSPGTFKELGVVEPLCEACERLGWKTPTPIQTQAIPFALQERDIIGLAETGSGKTGAFAIPILQRLLEKPQPYFALVLSPTRELAVQINAAFEALGSGIALRSAILVGGFDMVPQQMALGRKPHVIVATPGRLLDHLEATKGFSLRSLQFLVLDEADRMLDMDFSTSIDKILKFIPRERKTFLFSATINNKVESLQRASLRNPVKCSVGTDKYQIPATLKQNYLFVPLMHKDTFLVWLINEFAARSVIVFTRTVDGAQRLAILLRTLGFGALALHGQLSQSARLGALNKFKAGNREILVATDVAARGLDIPNVDYVINYELPADSKTYIHRIGRTARGGKAGHALSLVTQYDLETWLRIEAVLDQKYLEYPYEKDEVMVFKMRVEEAQRHAVQEMKIIHESSGRGKKGAGISGKRFAKHGNKRSRDHMDAEEG